MKKIKEKLTDENYHFLCGATQTFLDALFIGMNSRLGGELFENLLEEFRNRTGFEEVAFFGIAVYYCHNNGYSIDDLKDAFMNSVPDNETLLWMLEMLEK